MLTEDLFKIINIHKQVNQEKERTHVKHQSQDGL
jgi:hypothetical protein